MEKNNIKQPLIKFNNLSDFDKLLFANHHIKILKKIVKNKNFEIGILKSELDECMYKKTNNVKVINQRNLIRDLEKKNRDLKLINNKLMSQINE